MTAFGRRTFLKSSARGLSNLTAVTSAKASFVGTPSVSSSKSQRYGTTSPRLSFQAAWKDLQTNPFHHQDHATFHRLTTSLDALYSRCQQEVVSLQDRPVRLTAK